MFPTYNVPPVTGILWSPGAGAPQQLPPGALCTEADAKIAQAALGLGGTLVNAADYPALGFTFVNLDPASPYQPWYLMGIVGPNFIGYTVAYMYAPINPPVNGNGGGVGNPGALVNGKWVPAPVAAPVNNPLEGAPATMTDAQAFAAGEDVPGSAGDPQGAPPVPATALTAAQAASLTHIENILVRVFGA